MDHPKLTIHRPQLTNLIFHTEKEPSLKFSYGKSYTVKHIMMECKNVAFSRRAVLQSQYMKDLFKTTDSNIIINFLKKNRPLIKDMRP